MHTTHKNKKISIIIIPDSGGKTRTYTISQFGARVLMGVFICIIGGTGLLIFEYGNMIEKSLKIKALNSENEEMREKYAKLELFTQEFNELKDRTNKIANLLGVRQTSEQSSPKVAISFSSKNQIPSKIISSSPEITSSTSQVISRSSVILPNSLTSKEKAEQSLIPSIYPTKGWVTQKFSPTHNGIDFAAELGTPVFSTMSGTVIFTGWDEIFGNIIKITNKKWFKTVYGHLAGISVVKGLHINKGDLIGFVGSTGKSSAPHLHYEVWLNGVLQDPERYLILKEVR